MLALDDLAEVAASNEIPVAVMVEWVSVSGELLHSRWSRWSCLDCKHDKILAILVA